MAWSPFDEPIVDPASLEWTFPDGYRFNGFGHCRSCSKPIAWMVHERTEKSSPFNPDGTSHFTTCEHAQHWRDWSATKARKAGA